MKQGQKLERRYHRIREVVETITLTLLIVLIIRFAVENFRVDGQSMEPTLHNGEYILVDKVVYLFHPPERGDVIVFKYPQNPQVDFVKRIIAIPGDTISVVGQTVTVDGVVLNEFYVNKDDPNNPFSSFKNHPVGPNEYFVMGDNRSSSCDSRVWGTVSKDRIIGRIFARYWPLPRAHIM